MLKKLKKCKKIYNLNFINKKFLLKKSITIIKLQDKNHELNEQDLFNLFVGYYKLMKRTIYAQVEKEFIKKYCKSEQSIIKQKNK